MLAERVPITKISAIKGPTRHKLVSLRGKKCMSKIKWSQNWPHGLWNGSWFTIDHSPRRIYQACVLLPLKNQLWSLYWRLTPVKEYQKPYNSGIIVVSNQRLSRCHLDDLLIISWLLLIFCEYADFWSNYDIFSCFHVEMQSLEGGI